MKRRVLISSLSSSLLGASLANAAGVSPAPGVPAVPVTMSGTCRLQVLGGPARDRPYELLVSVPAGKAMPELGYPVLFVLDGNAHFGAFHDARRAQEAFAETIVVAVAYPTQETHDFLRRAYDYSPAAPPGTQPPQGGDLEFLDTLQQVVVPAIEARWQIDRGSMGLFGHSFGGMFALRALYTRPMFFTHYVAASPTLWWRDKYLLAPERAFVADLEQGRVRPVHQSLLLVIGDQEAPQEVQDAQSLQRRLEPLSRYGLRSDFSLVAGEDHMSLPIAIVTRVLRQVFTARRA